MSTVLHPVGPQPQGVYWRRRLVLLLVVVLVAAVTWAIVSGGRSGAVEQDAGDVTDTAGESAGAGADAGSDPAVEGAAVEGAAVEAPVEAPVDASAGPPGCTPADLAVTLGTATRLFAGEEQPVFAVGITNTAAGACTVDAGDAAREIVVTSGADRIWSTLDCPVESPARLLLLEPGARDEVQVTWPRVRSAEGCPADLPVPRAGTYSAVLTVLGTTSAAVVFDLG
ncbi:MAG: hypothetical protein JWP95_1688 [Actinotalea sp.]|nr:hypothetical protein [Actinotalea sp.]